MDLRQLGYFVAVAEEASFTRAAERVHISQSGVSAQLRQLEHEVGAELIDRSTRTARLTAAGRAALEPARAAIAAAEEVRRAVDETTGLVRGRLRLGMVVGCTVEPWFDALAAVAADHPGVELSLSEGVSDELVRRVAAGDLEAALVGTAGALPDGVRSFRIVSEGLTALVPHDTERSRRRLPVGELAGRLLVTMPTGTGVRTALDLACAAAGVRPTIAVEASAADAVAELAARGLGAGILSRSMARAYAGRLRLLDVVGVDVPAELAVVWSRRPGPGVRELATAVRTAFGKR